MDKYLFLIDNTNIVRCNDEFLYRNDLNNITHCKICGSKLNNNCYCVSINYNTNAYCSGNYIYIEDILICDKHDNDKLIWVEEKITSIDKYDVTNEYYQDCTICDERAGNTSDKNWVSVEVDIISKYNLKFTDTDLKDNVEYAQFCLCNTCHKILQKRLI